MANKLTIYKYIFPFSTSELTLRTYEDLDKKLLEDIALYLKTFQYELNQNILNSSAYKFREGELGVPIFVKTEFIEFLKMNINLAVESEGIFSPFEIDAEEVDIEDYIRIDQAGSSVFKLKDFKFNANLINRQYTMDVLKDFLIREKGIYDFLLSVNDQYIASGKSEWDIDISDQFKHTDEHEEHTIGVVNKAITIFGSRRDSAKIKTKFAATIEPFVPETIIIEGEFLCFNYLLTLLCEDLGLENEFQEFSNANNVNVTMIDTEDNIYVFEPS